MDCRELSGSPVYPRTFLSPIHSLPNETLVHIFRMLLEEASPDTLMQAARTCKHWKILIYDRLKHAKSFFWFKLTILPILFLPSSEHYAIGKEYRDWIRQQIHLLGAANTFQELMDCLQSTNTFLEKYGCLLNETEKYVLVNFLFYLEHRLHENHPFKTSLQVQNEVYPFVEQTYLLFKHCFNLISKEEEKLLLLCENEDSHFPNYLQELQDKLNTLKNQTFAYTDGFSVETAAIGSHIFFEAISPILPNSLQDIYALCRANTRTILSYLKRKSTPISHPLLMQFEKELGQLLHNSHITHVSKHYHADYAKNIEMVWNIRYPDYVLTLKMRISHDNATVLTMHFQGKNLNSRWVKLYGLFSLIPHLIALEFPHLKTAPSSAINFSQSIKVQFPLSDIKYLMVFINAITSNFLKLDCNQSPLDIIKLAYPHMTLTWENMEATCFQKTLDYNFILLGMSISPLLKLKIATYSLLGIANDNLGSITGQKSFNSTERHRQILSLYKLSEYSLKDICLMLLLTELEMHFLETLPFVNQLLKNENFRTRLPRLYNILYETMEKRARL
ncbi:F-box protein [Parachlamydia acanthamoebae]|jgi:hypothetical protein|uniref:F-box protein n=1 Tax=Parachlamydia acanthamoebae TaxID=83552 RepID=UPI0024E22A04|nr:F-box protein [Parachlamydia acanthamoebae]